MTETGRMPADGVSFHVIHAISVEKCMNQLFKQNSLPVRCLLWGTGKTFNKNYYIVKYFETLGEITVVGITSNDPLHSEIGGYKFIPKCELNISDVDAVIIMDEKIKSHKIASKIIKKAQIRSSNHFLP